MEGRRFSCGRRNLEEDPALPMYPELTDEQVNYVITTVREFFKLAPESRQSLGSLFAGRRSPFRQRLLCPPLAQASP
jgi:hypothetical protein